VENDKIQSPNAQLEQTKAVSVRKLRFYSIALASYILTFSFLIRFAVRLPYQLFILIALLNVVIIAVLCIQIQRARRQSQGGESGSSLV
jgi:hypothetical protein